MKKVFKVIESILMFSAGLMTGFAIMYCVCVLIDGITMAYPWWPIELLLGTAVAVFSAYELDKKSKELED